MENSFCFLCLAKVERSKVDLFSGNIKESTSAIKILLKYILDTKSGSGADNEVVLEDVLKLVGIGDGDDEEEDRKYSRSWRLCEECEGVAGKVFGLQLELEKVQMRIVEQVKLARAWILAISGWLGGGSEGEDGEDAFENFAKQFCDGQTSSKKRKVFEVLKGFQNTVREQEKTRVWMPFGRDTVAPISTSVNRNQNSINDNNEPEIKIEVEDDSVVKEEQEELDSLPDADWCSDPDTCPDPLAPSPQKPPQSAQQITVYQIRPRHTAQPSTTSASSSQSGSGQPQTKEELKPEPITTTGKRKQEHIVKVEEESDSSSDSDISSDPPSPLPPPHCPRPPQGIQQVIVYKVGQRQSGPLPLAATVRPKRIYLPRLKPKVCKLYKCENCDFTCLVRVCTFEQHLRSHETEEKLFFCKFCNQGFSTKQLHLFHEGRHLGRNKLACDICRHFFPVYELEAHIKLHGVKVFPCGNCSMFSSSATKYIKHMLSYHAGSDLKCGTCGEECSSMKKLEDHVQERHGTAEVLKCDLEGCDKTFSNPRKLEYHKISHTNRFSCKKCGKSFGNASLLRSHEALHRNEDIQCDQCPGVFSSKVSFQTHLAREHGAPKKKCEICGKEFNSAAGLKAHIHKDHEEKFKCQICMKTLSTRSAYNSHLETHSSENKYICSECGRSFKTDKSFRTHLKTHGEKNLKCPYCPKMFAYKTNMDLHVRTHTGHKPFPCPICGRRFTQAGARKIHSKKCELKAKASTSEEMDEGS